MFFKLWTFLFCNEDVHKACRIYLFIYFIWRFYQIIFTHFFFTNYRVIVTTYFSRCCGWLRFAAQPNNNNNNNKDDHDNNDGILINTMKKKNNNDNKKNRWSSANNQNGIGYRTFVLPDPSKYPQSSLGISFWSLNAFPVILLPTNTVDSW